jgi:hypothetical protein
MKLRKCFASGDFVKKVDEGEIHSLPLRLPLHQ